MAPLADRSPKGSESTGFTGGAMFVGFPITPTVRGSNPGLEVTGGRTGPPGVGPLVHPTTGSRATLEQVHVPGPLVMLLHDLEGTIHFIGFESVHDPKMIPHRRFLVLPCPHGEGVVDADFVE